MLWYSLDTDRIELFVFGLVDTKYANMSLVARAYGLTLIGWVLTYAGIAWGSRNGNRRLVLRFDRVLGLPSLSTGPNSNTNRDAHTIRIGAIMLGSGTAVYLFYIVKIGGLLHLWQNMYQRISLGSGLQYFSVFYSFSIITGSLLILSVLFKRKRYVRAGVIIAGGVLVFASLGGRGPVARFLFCVILLYHYTIQRVKTIVQPRFLILGGLLITFMAVIVQFRNPEGINKYKDAPLEIFTDAVHSFESTVISRFGRVERDIVILGYFDCHAFWLGRSYYSVLTAPIPRTLFDAKPPTDTGVYLKAMADGDIVTPPLASSELQATSWPLGNWEAYANFFLPGFFAAHVISGFILGFLFQYVKKARYAPGVVAFYALLLYGGNLPMSSLRIVSMLSILAVALLWSFLLRVLVRNKPLDCYLREILPRDGYRFRSTNMCHTAPRRAFQKPMQLNRKLAANRDGYV